METLHKRCTNREHLANKNVTWKAPPIQHTWQNKWPLINQKAFEVKSFGCDAGKLIISLAYKKNENQCGVNVAKNYKKTRKYQHEW